MRRVKEVGGVGEPILFLVHLFTRYKIILLLLQTMDSTIANYEGKFFSMRY